MPLKATQFRFQVAADDGISAQSTITIDGVTHWAGSLAKTQDVVHQTMELDYDTVPYSLAEFDIDVPAVSGSMPTHHLKTCTISITGGTVLMVGIAQTNNPIWQWVPNPSEPPPFIANYMGGNPEFSESFDIDTQPLWNGVALLNRYDIVYNQETGAGAVYIESGETVEFTLDLWSYCPVIT